MSNRTLGVIQALPGDCMNALYRQVEEQSDLCDVTVRVGPWKRRYHWCVLVNSPFFEAGYRQNMKEKEEGCVTLGLGDSATVDLLLQHLYGKSVTVTGDNVLSLLEVADFLLLETVRAKCVSIVEKIDVTTDSLFSISEAAYRYDIENNSIEECWQNDLPELCTKPEMLNCCKDDLVSILQSGNSSCMTKQLFELIVKWVKADSKNRTESFVELFLLLDYTGVDQKFIDENIMSEKLVITERNCQKKLVSDRSCMHDKQDAMLTSKTNDSSRDILAYVPGRGQWYLLGSLPLVSNAYRRLTLNGSDSQRAYFKSELNRDSDMIAFDLETKTYVLKKMEATAPRDIRHIVSCSDQLYAVEVSGYSTRAKTTLHRITDIETELVKMEPMLSFRGQTTAASASGNGVIFFLLSDGRMALYHPGKLCFKLLEVPCDYMYLENVQLIPLGDNGCTVTWIQKTTRRLHCMTVIVHLEDGKLVTEIEKRTEIFSAGNIRSCVYLWERWICFGFDGIYEKSVESSQWSKRQEYSPECSDRTVCIPVETKFLTCPQNCPHYCKVTKSQARVPHSRFTGLFDLLSLASCTADYGDYDESDNSAYGYGDGYMSSDDYYYYSSD